jgi:hypothetical protein
VSAGGWYSVRFYEQDIASGLFDDWRTLAWRQLYECADISTGAVRLTVREMALRWNTSVGGVERWLTALSDTGRNIRLEKIGPTAREGRRIIVLDIEERAQKRAGASRNKDRNKAGTTDGTRGGTRNPSKGNGNHTTDGTNSGTPDGTMLEHDLECVYRSKNYDVGVTIPAVSSAEGDGDLFGLSQPPAQAPPPTPEAPVAADAGSENANAVAVRVVGVFHELSKAGGGNGVSSGDWAAQTKMTATAIRKGLTEQEATDALKWGMRVEYQRRRLRAHGMKVLRDVWSEWVEETGGSNGRNGNGRNGFGGASGNGDSPEAGTAGAGTVIIHNGRWERRTN